MTGPLTRTTAPYDVSPRSRGVALALAVLLGWFGAHRFYVGRVGSAVVQLCTFGGLGLWALFDAIMIGTGNFRDLEGRRLLNWDPTELDEPYSELPPAVAAEFERLRSELDEMHERLDFTERMLQRLPAAREQERA